MNQDEKYMKAAIRQARKAYALDEVPIGCVIVQDDKIIARGYNRRNTEGNTLAHAELTAIRKASRKTGDWRLEDCTMYVTLEPCQMCAGAIVQSRMKKVVIGSMNPKAGQITKSILENITGSKKILLESNHDVEMLKCGTYPYPLKRRILGEYGHLSNETASKVALHLVQNGTEHIMLGHLSKENNRPEIAMLETYNLLSQSGVDVGKDMTLQVADRYKPTLF